MLGQFSRQSGSTKEKPTNTLPCDASRRERNGRRGRRSSIAIQIPGREVGNHRLGNQRQNTGSVVREYVGDTWDFVEHHRLGEYLSLYMDFSVRFDSRLRRRWSLAVDIGFFLLSDMTVLEELESRPRAFSSWRQPQAIVHPGKSAQRRSTLGQRWIPADTSPGSSLSHWSRSLYRKVSLSFSLSFSFINIIEEPFVDILHNPN